MRRKFLRFSEDDNLVMDVVDACGIVTAEKARGWFEHAGYVMQ